jgi:putative ABC transport system substrate-binding protein
MPADGDSTATKQRILVIKSRDIPFYNAALDGFISGLKARGYYNTNTVDLKIIALTGDTEKDSDAIKAQLSKSNSLIFTLGTDATAAVQKDHPAAPCLFTMLVDPVSLGVAKSLSQPGENFTGTTLLVDPGKQLEALQQISSAVKKVGVLYTTGDATSLKFLSEASEEAHGMGMEIDAVPIKNYATDGQAALTQLASKVDAFWVIVDPASASPQALTDTMRIAESHKLPVLGMSNSNVRVGALLSLSANLRDLGDVDAEIAGPLLDGTSHSSDTPIRGPRQTILAINLHSAKDLHITVPTSVLQLADEVIDDSETAAK